MSRAGAGVSAPAASELAADWDARVRGNREQVERCRRVGEATDFYAPVTARFVQDPRRDDDPVLDALVGLVRSGEVCLDIGAGAGRYALPIALRADRVIALDPSPAMLEQLREGMERHDIANVRTLQGRWPDDADLVQDAGAGVCLIAHVGYDVEPITPFLEAMERAAARRCVAVLMDRSPAGYASPFWPAVHHEERVELPAAGELLALLRARGVRPRVRRLPRPQPAWPDEAAMLEMLRHQLWIPDAGPEHDRLVAAVRRVAISGPDGISLPTRAGWIGVIDWRPRGR